MAAAADADDGSVDIDDDEEQALLMAIEVLHNSLQTMLQPA